MPGGVEAEWVLILNKTSGQVRLSEVLKRRAVVRQIPGESVAGRGNSLGAQRSPEMETVVSRAESRMEGGGHEGEELIAILRTLTLFSR